MKNIPEPAKRHTSGKLPTHSSTKNLSINFAHLDQTSLMSVLQSCDVVDAHNKPQKQAVQHELVDRCGKIFLWNLENLEKFLVNAHLTVKRCYVNQEPPVKNSMEPTWANLTTIGTYFNVSATQVGKWLDELDLREQGGLPNKYSTDQGLSQVVEMSAGGKKTRKIAQWDLHLIIDLLMNEGHPLDFDYSKTLSGKGKNSAVEVSSMDSRARSFAKEFTNLYNERSQDCKDLVRKTPKPILEKAEDLLKKPGFILDGKYLERLR